MPKTELLLPKFLTQEMVKEALLAAAEAAMTPPLGVHLKQRSMLHIVVLVPAMKDDRAAGYPDWPAYPTEPHAIAEVSYGDKAKWPHKFDEIARCKALQLWTGRNDGGTDISPHLLFPGDAPFCGGVNRSGIVVACSGVQFWFDRMIASMVADICIAFAYDAWMKSDDRKKGFDFLA